MLALALIAALLGVAVVTTGLFLLFGRDGRRRAIGRARRLRRVLLGAALVTTGAAALALTWLRWPVPAIAVDAPATTAGAGTPPPAAAPLPETPVLHGRRLLVLAWGTPSDIDQAAPDEEAAYGDRLSELAQHVLQGAAPSLRVERATVSRSAIQPLLQRSSERPQWCDERADGLVLAIAMGAEHLAASDSFAPWREPVLELYDCDARRGLWEAVQVEERRGDAFPYQQALGEQLYRLVARFNGQANGS